MNKLSVVLGVAALVTVAGCKDPDYNSRRVRVQDEVKQVEAETAKPVEVKPQEKLCTCPKGTKHTKPCQCGASNCECVVVQAAPKPVAPAPVKVEPEYTTYVVQRGDYLAKISKRFNIKLDSIRKLNPSIKKDVVRIGMKIKLPGKVDLGAAPAAPAAAPAPKKASAAKPAPSYTGATKEYVVKSGDTLGAIAYGHGINIRQLKALNSLKNDNLRIGQKLKVPAQKAAAAKAAPAKPVESKPAPQTAPVQPKAEEPAVEQPAAPAQPAAEPQSAPAPAVEAQPAAEPAAVESAPVAANPTYVVQEGDDMTGVSIRWSVSAAAIRELNNLGENDQLVPGQIIKLPAEAQQ